MDISNETLIVIIVSKVTLQVVSAYTTTNWHQFFLANFILTRVTHNEVKTFLEEHCHFLTFCFLRTVFIEIGRLTRTSDENCNHPTQFSEYFKVKE